MDHGWLEVGAGCFVRRYDPYDVSCGVVAGDDGLLLVDTRDDRSQGEELVTDVRRLSSLPVAAVVLTHAHHDHVRGTAAVRAAYPEVVVAGHESLADEILADCEQDGIDPAGLVPDRGLASVWSVDLGGRQVEAVALGHGHTAGDVAIRVPDADVVYAGDVVEESAPPSYGTDCWPLEWAQQLELLSGLLTDASVVVPGHGAPVDRGFVHAQRGDLADVAGQLRALADSGVPVDEAAARGSWPWPDARLDKAARRAYAALGR